MTKLCIKSGCEKFELLGKITLIIAAKKMDLRTLVKRGLSWNDAISDDLRPVCVSGDW